MRSKPDLKSTDAGEIRDFRSLPSVSRLLEAVEANGAPHDVVVRAAREVLDDARREIASGGYIAEHELRARLRANIKIAVSSWPTKVINATGVVLHTNLGRAVLSADAVRAMTEAAAYSDLEMDLGSGQRGHRDAHVANLLHEITGAEAATVVNNNAGALVFCLSALARGREVVVSRGEAVEIGGRFRIPDVLHQSGAILREVGTTNRTYGYDYENACNELTAVLLKVHRSNFYLGGFTSQVELSELVGIAQQTPTIVLNDLGSGCLVDTAALGLKHEPTVQESIRAGTDLTVFSGDKLLGGPQAGIVIGRADLVDRLRKHPLARALRCDKVTLAALHATLLHYLRGEEWEKIPTLRMLALKPEELKAVAMRWQSELNLTGVDVIASRSRVGGGSLPQVELQGYSLVVCPEAFGVSSQDLVHRLRTLPVPVVARVEDDKVWLDPRTVQPDESSDLVRAIQQVLA